MVPDRHHEGLVEREPLEDDDTHRFTVQWRSPSGGLVTLRIGALNLLFDRGTRNC